MTAKRWGAAVLPCALLLACLPSSARQGHSFHSAGVIGYYKHEGHLVSLNASALVFDSDTSHLLQGVSGVGSDFVRFYSTRLNVAIIKKPNAIVNYDGLYWPSTPSIGEGTPAILTFTVEKNSKKCFVLIVAKKDHSVLYRYQGAFASASVLVN